MNPKMEVMFGAFIGIEGGKIVSLGKTAPKEQPKTVIDGRKVKYYPFYVTRVTDCPSILLENGFMTNDAELENLTDGAYTKKLARAIAKGVCEYFRAN